MTIYYVTPLVNVDLAYRVGDVWTPGDQVALVDTYRVESSTVGNALEQAFTLGNGIISDLDAEEWPNDVRSLSVGDLIEITDLEVVEVYAIEPFGFKKVVASVRDMVPLAGTAATSRVAV